jgi:glycosyltransferase involved in cell wall biosynthesis
MDVDMRVQSGSRRVRGLLRPILSNYQFKKSIPPRPSALTDASQSGPRTAVGEEIRIDHRPILIVTNRPGYPEALGGTEMFTYRLAKELARRGHEVGMISSDCNKGTFALYSSIGVHRLSRFPRFMNNKHSIDKMLINFFAALVRGARMRGAPILSIASPSLLIGYPISRILMRHCYVRFIGSDIYLLDFKPHTPNERINTIFARMGFHLAKRADRVVVMNEWMRKALVTKGLESKKIIIIPNGSDFAPSESPIAAVGTLRLTYVGRFSRGIAGEKRVSVLISAFSEFVRSHPNASLTLVGDGTERASLERLVRDLAIVDKVRFTGNLTPDQVKWELENSDCFVFPSVMEGMSNSLVEAVLSGIPVVAADIPQNRELLEMVPGSTLVDPALSDSLERGLDEACSNLEERKHLALAAATRLRQTFSFESVATKYEETLLH